MTWLIIFAIILIAFAIAVCLQFFNLIFRGFAPLISSRPGVVKKILDEVDFSKDKIKVYELGCGKAGFLRAVEERKGEWEFIGVENSFFPWLLAKIQVSLSKSKIKIVKKNLFKVNLADADLIYCYLNVKMMNRLEEKFKKECKPGTKIISYTFSMPNLDPEKVVDLEKKGKVYFYTI